MLHISPQAVQALTEVRDAEGHPESSGLRIFADVDPESDADPVLAVAFVEEPEQDDEVSEQEGVPVYVAPELAEPLSSSVMDVQEGPQGRELILRAQELDES